MANARPIAVVRLSAKIDTSVKKVVTRSTARDPRIAMMPTPTGSAAANSPPNTHSRTMKLSGTTMDSSSGRSRCDCRVICRFTMATPPERTMMPSVSLAICLVSDSVYSSWVLSEPVIPATIRPDFLSLLTRSEPAPGGTVHAEVTEAT